MKTNYTFFLTSYAAGITKNSRFSKTGLNSLLLTVIVLVFFTFTFNMQQVSGQTFSEYQFEETSGEDVLDSNGSNDGKIINSVTRVDDGFKGKALEFTEEGYIRLKNTSVSDVPNGFTISVWLKPGQISASSSESFMGVVMHAADSATLTDTYAIYLHPSSNGIGFKTSGTTEAWRMPSSPILWDGEWHHLVVTYNGEAKVMYLDNEVIDSVAATGTMESGIGHDLLIGAGYDHKPIRMLYTGLLDEVRIYDYGLTHEEISMLYIPERTYSEYEFEENSGDNILDSNGLNDGIIINTVSRIDDGIKGKALEFTEAGYIDLGSNEFFDIREQITISAWVKPALTGSYMGIVMKGAVEYDTYALYVEPDNQAIGWSTAGTTEQWTYISGINDLYDGEWHHLVATYDGAKKVIYLDNTEIISRDVTGEIDSGSGYRLLIGAGRDREDPVLLYNGLLDEVRIYDSALTPSEISTLFSMVNSSKISSVNPVNNIKIFPNPVNDLINIEFLTLPEEVIEISLFDPTGRQIFRREVQSNIETFNLEQLSAGFYILSINGRSMTQKSIIVKSK